MAIIASPASITSSKELATNFKMAARKISTLTKAIVANGNRGRAINLHNNLTQQIIPIMAKNLFTCNNNSPDIKINGPLKEPVLYYTYILEESNSLVKFTAFQTRNIWEQQIESSKQKGNAHKYLSLCQNALMELKGVEKILQVAQEMNKNAKNDYLAEAEKQINELKNQIKECISIGIKEINSVLKQNDNGTISGSTYLGITKALNLVQKCLSYEVTNGDLNGFTDVNKRFLKTIGTFKNFENNFQNGRTEDFPLTRLAKTLATDLGQKADKVLRERGVWQKARFLSEAIKHYKRIKSELEDAKARHNGQAESLFKTAEKNLELLENVIQKVSEHVIDYKNNRWALKKIRAESTALKNIRKLCDFIIILSVSAGAALLLAPTSLGVSGALFGLWIIGTSAAILLPIRKLIEASTAEKEQFIDYFKRNYMATAAKSNVKKTISIFKAIRIKELEKSKNDVYTFNFSTETIESIGRILSPQMVPQVFEIGYAIDNGMIEKDDIYIHCFKPNKFTEPEYIALLCLLNSKQIKEEVRAIIKEYENSKKIEDKRDTYASIISSESSEIDRESALMRLRCKNTSIGRQNPEQYHAKYDMKKNAKQLKTIIDNYKYIDGKINWEEIYQKYSEEINLGKNI